MSDQLTRPNIAIVGFSDAHLNEAPFDDSDWEVWGINRLHIKKDGRHFDRWFQIHDLERHHGNDEEHIDFLRTFDGPVYLRQADIGKYDIPNAVPLPVDELTNRFGRYFNNTISWLIAYAISMEPEGLGLYGVDMAQDTIMHAEYSQQRPSCEYFLGLAEGRGIKIYLPDGTDLLRSSHLYGFEDSSVFVKKLMSRQGELSTRKEETKTKVAQLEAQIAGIEEEKGRLLSAVNQYDGAMQDIQYWIRTWVPISEESGV